MNRSADRHPRAIHQIRLGGQWDLEPLSDGTPRASMADTQRLKQLSDYRRAATGTCTGRVRLVRRFGRPTGVTPREHVHLVSDGLPSAAVVALNDQVLEALPAATDSAASGRAHSARYDVSAALEARNRLTIEFDESQVTGASEAIIDVRLEIIDGAC